MAHLIAPPSSVQPMTKEDVAVVQAEKRVDAATREQLVKVYGDSRDPHGRPVDLKRPAHRNWKCAACGKVSVDIRHVCGNCLNPEPGYVSARPQSTKSTKGVDAHTQAAEVASTANIRRAGTSNDAGVRLVQIASTKRTYRTYAEPHVPTVASNSKAGQRAATAMDGGEQREVRDGDEDEDDDPVWDDEPDCGEGQSCRPGGGGKKVEANSGTTAAAARHAPREEQVDGGFTHFVSIPLGKLPAITANATRVLEDLRSFVGAGAHAAEEGEGEGTSRAAASTAATPDLVTNTARLHMTLLLLTLPNREDVEFARELLQGAFATAWAAVKEKAVASRKKATSSPAAAAGAVADLSLSGDASLAPVHRHPLIHLGGGLQVMRDGKDNELYHPQKASVVYMGIDDPLAHSTVQQLQRVLHDSFAELIHNSEEAERSRRVLHVTIMNKKWHKAGGARRPFDARPIIDAFPDANIGAGDDGRQLFEIPELELCSMRRRDAETGTYLAEAVVKI